MTRCYKRSSRVTFDFATCSSFDLNKHVLPMPKREYFFPFYSIISDVFGEMLCLAGFDCWVRNVDTDGNR